MLVEYAQRPSSAWWQLWLDDVREVPLIQVRSDLELAAGHTYIAEGLSAVTVPGVLHYLPPVVALTPSLDGW
jgi:hypothetical protein